MHDASTVHMLKSAADLNEVFPDGSFRNESLLPSEVLYHARKVACVGQLQHNVQLVALDERAQVLDHVRMIKMFEQLDLVQTILPRFRVHQLEDLRSENSEALLNRTSSLVRNSY